MKDTMALQFRASFFKVLVFRLGSVTTRRWTLYRLCTHVHQLDSFG